MSYINNMNPRRMIWFNQNAPKNKMDLWLSYNRHYEDTSEDETVDPQLVDDNPSQRKCDLILKAWDCGLWVPIVGFNTTAANKIDTVEGNTLYHPAIFTGENPNDLYDAGSLGSLLSNPNFVTELEWHDVFNSSNYDWGDIFGDTNWFGDLIWETIQGGSSTYHLPWATTTQCGGILSATHPAASTAFKPIEVKFYPTVLGYYQNEQHRLCVSASDVIQLINNYYNDNPSGSSININWNSTTIHQLAEVLEDIFKNSSSLGFEDVWSLASDPHVYPHIWGVSSSNAGKFLKIKDVFPEEGSGWALNNNAMEWIDIVAGDGVSIENVTSGGVTSMVISAEGSQDTWRPISAMISLHEQPIPSGNALYIAEGTGVNININTVGSGTTLTFSASGTDYTGTNLINVSGSVIGIDMSSNPSNGDVIICDSGVAKWGATPNPKFSGLSINANNGDATLNGLVLSSNASLQIEGEQSTRSEYSLNTWNYYNISNFKSFNIEDVPDEMEPIYIRLIESTAAVGCTGDIIDIGDVLSSPSGKDIFITMQFNIAKFEEINVLSTPVINDLN